MSRDSCSCCHSCGTEMRPGLERNSEWCKHCNESRHYESHVKTINTAFRKLTDDIEAALGNKEDGFDDPT